MRIKTTHILILVMGVIIALMLYCSPVSPTIEDPVVNRVVVRDTLFTEGKIDTIYFHDTVPKYIKVPIYVPVYDTTEKLNIYTNKYNDSLINGEIISKVDGVLVEQSLLYNAKFPKYIYRTDTLNIFIKDSVTVTLAKPKKNLIYAGLLVGSNGDNMSISPTISLADKRNNLFSFSYNIIGKQYIVGYQRKISLKR